MAERFVQSHVRRLLLFERLPDSQLELVASAFQVLRFEPGAVVFREGQPAQGLFYFVAGRGVLTRWEENERGEAVEIPFGEVRANEFIGEAALFTQMVEAATLHIVEPSIVLFLSRQRLAMLVMQHPELRLNLGFQGGEYQLAVKPLFKGQRADEVVLQIFRRHWWSYGRYAWLPLLLAAAFIIGAIVVAGPTLLGLGLIGLGLILPSALMYYLYVEWQDDALVVTDQRVVRIRNVLFGLHNSLSEIPLERVQEVSISIPPADPFSRLFGYGTITVKTAGELGHVSMSVIPKPDRVRTLIFEYREQVRRSVAEQNRREIEAEINRVLGLSAEETSASAVSAMPSPVVTSSRSGGFVFAPLRTRFIDENGNTVYRKHITVWLSHIMLPLLFLLIGLALIGVSLAGVVPEYAGVGLLIGAIIVFVSSIALYLADWDWRNDHFVLGQDVITLIRKRPLWLQAEVDQIRLEKVDSVVSSVRGLFNNLIDRGRVEISLIGTDAPKVMDNVPTPKELQAEISQRLARQRQLAQRAYTESQRQAIAEYLAAYHEKVAGNATPPRSAGSEDTIARDVSAQMQNTEVQPPRTVRDAVRPPRVPRLRNDLD